ncbi:hypothetical protein, partial [Agrobacterium arsenijevicii]|uniref:hypothetical protein n=1 Tax=Agrobacterium arsenijevicii TaxID=1585697 RepID=UPI0033065894
RPVQTIQENKGLEREPIWPAACPKHKLYPRGNYVRTSVTARRTYFGLPHDADYPAFRRARDGRDGDR